MADDVSLDPAYTEAGRLLAEEDPKDLARKVLKALLPRFPPDKAREYLLKWGTHLDAVRQMDVEHEIISAALYVLATPDPEVQLQDRTLRAALERALDDFRTAENYMRAGQSSPVRIRELHEAQVRIAKALDPLG